MHFPTRDEIDSMSVSEVCELIRNMVDVLCEGIDQGLFDSAA